MKKCVIWRIQWLVPRIRSSLRDRVDKPEVKRWEEEWGSAMYFDTLWLYLGSYDKAFLIGYVCI
jgi:hypothetical protein